LKNILKLFICITKYVDYKVTNTGHHANIDQYKTQFSSRCTRK